MTAPRIAPAEATELAAVTALVVGADLPSGGLAAQFPDAFVVVREAGVPIAAAGLEIYGAVGLLRSVAVRDDRRGAGLGRALVAERLAAARSRGLGAVYLLTTTAAPYFARLGFLPAERAAVPAELAAAPEFRSVCPATAECLVWRPAAGESTPPTPIPIPDLP